MKSHQMRDECRREIQSRSAPWRKGLRSAGVFLLLCSVAMDWAGAAKVTAQIQVVQTGRQKASSISANDNVVVWLTSLSEMMPPAKPRRFRMVQKDKEFSPHLLVVPTGSVVEFPNLDPFFHNVFSLFNGKRFDLGLYEEGSARAVHFDHAGVSYLFCNIHPQMNAVVIALSTPYVAVSTAEGAVVFPDVLPGTYEVRVWAEGADAQELEQLARQIHVGDAGLDIGKIPVQRNGDNASHKNKFGEEYSPDAATY